MKQLRAAIYTRISTREGKQNSSNQLRQLREYVKKQGWRLVDRIYADQDTGGRPDREQFTALFADAHKGLFEVVVFWSLDRFSREGVYPTLAHLKRLTDSGVNFVSITQEFLNSTGVFRDAIISILATLAQQERQIMSQRTKAGLARAREQGKQIGRPRRTVDLAAVKAYRERFRWRPISSMAKELNIPETTLRRAMQGAELLPKPEPGRRRRFW